MSKVASRLVVVVGCGRLGSLLASRLSLRGLEVVIVDTDENAFEALWPEFSGFRVEGDATELAVLRKARVTDASSVIVTTGDDNTNMMVAQVAREILQAQHALARVLDPAREAIYRGLEIETFCPTTLAADVAIERLASSLAAPQEAAR